jgi:hypothetical protein
MNQNSNRGGEANRNSVEQVQRGATRPAAVVAIVLCLGFAVAMVGIWSCEKPPSQQETQTQPEAAVQTETPKPETETTDTGTEVPTPEAVSPLSVPDRSVPQQPATATPFSQASPAAGQLTDDHVNSPTPAEDEQSYDFSHELNEEPVTFEAVDPTTKIPGSMTVTVTGTYRGKRLGDGQSPGGSHLEADQQATFSFVPSDRYSPSYSATVRTLKVAGNTTNDSLSFDFGLQATATDGSSQQFTLKEVVTITKDGAHVTFMQVK